MWFFAGCQEDWLVEKKNWVVLLHIWVDSCLSYSGTVFWDYNKEEKTGKPETGRRTYLHQIQKG